MQNQTDKFLNDYQKLNAPQKKAVDQIDGPVLVIAGPGTGKTQILAARIANILIKTDSLPENILCLTYTDAGTIAMRKRLIQFIGPDAYRVGIYTFHGFCNSVIQDNLEIFGLRNLDPVSELEKIQFVREVIDSFQKGSALKKYTGDIYYDSHRLLNLFDAMKREDWTSDIIIQKADSYISDLPGRDEYIYKRDSKFGKKGELKQKEIDAEIKRMEELKAAALSYDLYIEKCKKNNRYDFSDMILWVINAFKQTPEFLLPYQEKYHYFLVDEFQDTNGSQNEILQLLINYWNDPNVFVVGDDDQSIYRFQGANIENIKRFSETFAASLNVILLTENYRSTQHILDVSKSLIEKNSERISTNKILNAANVDYAGLTEIPEIRAYYNIAHETVGTATEIEMLINNGTPLKDIAVIYRNHSQADELVRYLQSKKISVNIRRRINILSEPLIKKLTTILRYIQCENLRSHSGEHYLFEILHYSEFDIHPLEIARLSVEIYRKNFNDRSTSWREELRNFSNKNQPSLFSDNTVFSAISNFSNLTEALINDSMNIPLLFLVENILSRCGILFTALSAEDKTWNMEMLNTFFDFIKNECSKKPKTNLKQFLEILSMMEENEIPLPAEKISYSENGVNFITAHSSKGLEFEYVFITGCLKDKWDKAKGGSNFKLPDNLFEIPGDETQEARRLFYVAMTRAKRQLIISYPERDNNSKELEKSRFVSELEDSGNVVTGNIHLEDEELIHFQMQTIQKPENTIPSGLFDSHFIDTILDTYSLSVTHLNNYLKCPVSFYFNNLIKVPAAKNPAMTFGSAVHYALEKLFRNMNAHPQKQFGSKEDLLKDFKWYMRRNEESFTETEFKLKIEYAEQVLPAFYDRYINEWNKITSVERTYSNVVVDGVPINGKLDKLEFEGNKVNVVDYKTGQFKNAEKKFERPDQEKYQKSLDENKEPKFENKYGGDYWRQSVFYKILMDNDKSKNREMNSVEFDFVEPEKETKKFIKHRIQIHSTDIEIVKKQITKTYSQILNKEFSKGCGKPDCEWCNFAEMYYTGKKNKTVKVISPDESE